MDFEAYKVAVRVSMTENVTAGLLAISRKFGAAEIDAQRFESTLARIGKMTLVGGALVGVGLVITKGLDATIKAANNLVKAQNDFKTLNLTVQDNALVNSTAQVVSHQVLGTTIAGNIRLIQDLHTALGSLPHSIELAPMFAKYESTIGMALGEHAKDGMVNAAARALEHRGGSVVNDPKEFQKELDWMSQVQLASKGRVSPKDFLAASQSGKMAYTLLDPKYLYGAFAGLMSMNGGFQSGTALMTTFSSLVGGHMDKKAKGFLADIGMSSEGVSKARIKMMADVMNGMTPQEREVYKQSLGGESLLSGGLSDQYVKMFSNPDQLAAVMAQKIREKYGKNLTDTEVAEMIARNFNRNTGGFLGQHILNAQKLQKDSAIFRHAEDYNQAYDTYLNSPDGAGMALSSSWENLKAVLGLQLIPMVTSATMGLAKFVDKISDLVEKYPVIAKVLMYSAAAVAGLALVSGSILLLGATIMAARLVGSLGVVSSMATMLGGPVVWAIVGIAAAGLLIYKNWDKIKPAGIQMGKEFSGIMTDVWNRMKQAGDHALNYFKSWSIWEPIEKSFDSFSSKITSGFNSLFDMVVGLLNKIPGIHINTGNPNTNLPVIKPPKQTDVDFGGKDKPAPQVSPTGMAAGYAAANGRSPLPTKPPYGAPLKVAPMNTTVPVPPKQGQTIQVHSTVNMDGKTVAQTVTTHQTKEATKPPAGVSAYDSSMTQFYSGQMSKLGAQ